MTSRQRETAEALRHAPGARFTVHVRGTSMSPTLREGDVLQVERTAGPQGCSLGDLVALVRPDVGVVVHRLLWTGRSHVRTRGDGSGLMDARIAHADVLGRVVSALRDGVDVMPSALSRRLAWTLHFAQAGLRWALHRADAHRRARLVPSTERMTS